MIFNRFATVACCVIISIGLFARSKPVKIKFGDFKAEDFAPTVYSIDSSADAVYLYDIGSSKHEGNAQGCFLFEDYETLRNFYAFVVEKQAEQIVFKRIDVV